MGRNGNYNESIIENILTSDTSLSACNIEYAIKLFAAIDIIAIILTMLVKITGADLPLVMTKIITAAIIMLCVGCIYFGLPKFFEFVSAYIKARNKR